jgi:K(+)-stimulated pyrophosphate-energized sodium pump
MIKVINMVSLLCAPVLVVYQMPGVTHPGMIASGFLCLIIIVGSIIFSKRGGFRKQVFEP